MWVYGQEQSYKSSYIFSHEYSFLPLMLHYMLWTAVNIHTHNVALLHMSTTVDVFLCCLHLTGLVCCYGFEYKMCLRLYLNGDGSGKGTHLSFFLTIMRGEYNALSSWPFQHVVTLMLLILARFSETMFLYCGVLQFEINSCQSQLSTLMECNVVFQFRIDNFKDMRRCG